MKTKGSKCLTWTQRLQLESLLNAKVHKKKIAETLGVCLTTIYNEIKRGNYVHRFKVTDECGYVTYKEDVRYSPDIAEEKYRMNMTAKGRPLKVGNDFEFVRYVEKRVLKDKISPCAVVGEIKRNRPCVTIVSKTTMYRYITIGIFMNIRMEDTPMPRKRKYRRKAIAKRPPKGTSIERRPEDISSRKEFGHWEMDCVIGKQQTRNVFLVLTERKTRYELVIRMPNRRTGTVVKVLNRIERRYGKNFRKMFKTITVDNGSEFSDFRGLERSIYGGRRTQVYYCHPYTSCERGSNERINRDIRRLCPKGTDLGKYTNEEVQAVEDWVNAYPRAILGYATAAECFAEELAKIAG